MPTRERILDAALRIFNEESTADVSTNHIAAAAGISPGNLYYHFRNKEEIVRALFERLFATHDRVFALPDDRLPTLEDMRGLVRVTFDVQWEFRFVYRDLVSLLRRDPLLRERWLEVRRRGFEGFHQLVALFASAGVVNAPADPATVQRLADLIWLISEFWLPSLEVNGLPVDATQRDRGIDLMLLVLQLIVNPAQEAKDSPQ